MNLKVMLRTTVRFYVIPPGNPKRTLYMNTNYQGGRDSEVNIPTTLLAVQTGDRISVRAIFPPPVQTACGAHPATYTVGTGSFQGAKRLGCGVNH
jgi:hypothetical protein